MPTRVSERFVAAHARISHGPRGLKPRLMRRATALLFTVVCGSFAGCATVYTGAHWMTLGVSRVRSPLHVRLPFGNAPLSIEQYHAVREIPPTDPAEDPLLNELKLPERLAANGGEVTLRFVALSGGGARAAAFSAYVLREMEAQHNSTGGDTALFDSIDGFSTVSGGSIYAGYVAVTYGLNESGRAFLFSSVNAVRELRGQGTADRHHAFQVLAEKYFDYYAYLGGRAGCAYINPANLLAGPIFSLFTDADIVDLYAQTLDTDYAFSAYTQLKFQHLERRPKFFFNTTNHSDFRPFLFTQGRFHRGPAVDFVGSESGRSFENPLIRWHRSDDSEFENGRPFPYALSLEDINSDSEKFPISYAVMGSAAFPGATEPMPMWYYKPVEEGDDLEFEKDAIVRVVDGGLYENYGLAAAFETYEYVRRKLAPQGVTVNLKILSVDSANRVKPIRDEGCLGLNSPIDCGFPVRGVMPAIESMSRSYDAGQAVIRSILRKRAEVADESGSIDVTEINLAQCTHFDEKDGEDVKTDYIISGAEAEILEKCARELVDHPEGAQRFLHGG